MSQRVTLLGTNWKMNKTVSEAEEYIGVLLNQLGDLNGRTDLQIFVIPPYTAIQTVKQRSNGKLRR